jgi:hypothetical protein
MFVSQAILTPQLKTLLKNPFMGLYRATKQCRKKLPNWIVKTKAAKENVNIVLTDFVTDTKITSAIIEMNYK